MNPEDKYGAREEEWQKWKEQVKEHLKRESTWRENMRDELDTFRGRAGAAVTEADDVRAALSEMCYEERMNWQAEERRLNQEIYDTIEQLNSCREGCGSLDGVGGGRQVARDRDSRGNSQRGVKKPKKTKRRRTRKKTRKIKRKRTQKKKLSNKR
tara:strand:+ start:238 stop:702 length:465 start_codon:yes stop_codon:yes gene_type:complete